MNAEEHGGAQAGVEGVGKQPKTVNIAILLARKRASISPCSRCPTSGLAFTSRAFTSRGVGWLVANGGFAIGGKDFKDLAGDAATTRCTPRGSLPN